jgi:hypothetical protein
VVISASGGTRRNSASNAQVTATGHSTRFATSSSSASGACGSPPSRRAWSSIALLITALRSTGSTIT